MVEQQQQEGGDYSSHIVIMQHGLHGSEQDFEYVDELLKKTYKGLHTVSKYYLITFIVIPFTHNVNEYTVFSKIK